MKTESVKNRRQRRYSMNIEMDEESSNHGINQSNQTPSNIANKSNETSSFFDVINARVIYITAIITMLLITIVCISMIVLYERRTDVTHSVDAWREELPREQMQWFQEGLDDLKKALQVKINTRRAKNVIFFMGDGMGINTVTAARIYKYGESGEFSWEKFPNLGLLKTYCNDKQVTDSAAAATALFCGVKTNYETSGVDSSVKLSDCQTSLNESHHVHSILKWAQDEGMATGFVTTTRVSHATPSALYSHTANRKWECEATMKEIMNRRGCKDIARQLVEDDPGRNINVIMGGGRQCLVSNVTASKEDPIDTWSCYSKDGRDLIHDWKILKEQEKKRFTYVKNTEELNNVKAEDVDYLLGIFANGHLKYEDERDTSPKGMPSLTNMTEKALQILKKNQKGFVLVVEGGKIDQAHHRGWVRRALSETAALDDAVQRAIEVMKNELDETLIIMAADHAHTLSINGYASRGADILGVAQKSKIDQIPYTTLTYGTGGPASFQMMVDDSGMVHRRDPTKEDTRAFDYVPQAAILTNENTHGGADISIHAMGPMSHLFHRVHEQSYVAHVISYAARIGRFRDSKLVEDILDYLVR